MAEVALFQSPYVYAGNTPITSIDYNGKFKVKVSKGAQQAGVNQDNMKNFNRVAANIGNVLKDNSHVLNTMVEQTGMSSDQILGMMEWGKGPTISIDDKTNDLYGAQGNADGISIDTNIVMQIGSLSEGDAGYESALITLAETILHEATHVGDAQTNGDVTTGTEGDMGNQNTASKYGHRGLDTDKSMVGHTSTYTPHSSSFATGTYWKRSTGQAFAMPERQVKGPVGDSRA